MSARALSLLFRGALRPSHAGAGCPHLRPFHALAAHHLPRSPAVGASRAAGSATAKNKLKAKQCREQLGQRAAVKRSEVAAADVSAKAVELSVTAADAAATATNNTLRYVGVAVTVVVCGGIAYGWNEAVFLLRKFERLRRDGLAHRINKNGAVPLSTSLSAAPATEEAVAQAVPADAPATEEVEVAQGVAQAAPIDASDAEPTSAPESTTPAWVMRAGDAISAASNFVCSLLASARAALGELRMLGQRSAPVFFAQVHAGLASARATLPPRLQLSLSDEIVQWGASISTGTAVGVLAYRLLP
ncbi:hypothetical protein T492DRAFT_1090897 [Pavlovales sp. CCMP2436]|nr:hypothetical protein T492DRAFT_1090897 [Pavlovales sp. CCMP2436]